MEGKTKMIMPSKKNKTKRVVISQTQTPFLKEPIFKKKCPFEQISDRFLPARIKLLAENSDNINLNMFSNLKYQNPVEKSNYIKALESELIECNTPTVNRGLGHNSGNLDQPSIILNPGRNVIYKEIKKMRSNISKSIAKLNILEDQKSSQEAVKQVKPFKTFNFGELADNFYANVFDWQYERALISTQNQMILFDPVKLDKTNTIDRNFLCYNSNKEITALKQLNEDHIIVCDTDCILFDINKFVTSHIKIEGNRITTIDKIDENLIVLGSEKCSVFFMDLRIKSSLTSIYKHNSEVCKVKYNPQLSLIVSGGNDNKLMIYDVRGKNKEIKVLEHNAAIKAIDFQKNRFDLVSGGGYQDTKIKVWDLGKYELIKEKVTESQISDLFCLSNQNIVCSNGYSSNNIILWKYAENITKLCTFKPHPKRILYSTISPCEKFLLSGSCDGTINLWKLPETECKSTFSKNQILR